MSQHLQAAKNPDKNNSPLLLRACRNEVTERPPVWMMRQAGRYMAEYQALRSGRTFMELCKNIELATEVSLQPYQAFAMDGVIMFSDILTIPDAMGLGLSFTEGMGPRFETPIRHIDQVAKLPIPDPAVDIAYVPAILKNLRQALGSDTQTALIGFSGAPWTLAAYMIEGGSSKHFQLLKQWLFEQPEALETLLAKLTLSVIAYLNAQIEAGAQVLQLFDTWAGILSHAQYERFVLPYHQQIIENLIRRDEVPVILYVNGSRGLLDLMVKAKPDVISVDEKTALGEARKIVDPNIALQGNLDPLALYCAPEVLKPMTQRLIAEGGTQGYIFNLGHGILPKTPVEHVRLVVDTVKSSAVLPVS
ncbi:MAG: uroporphyrinogen decarboxylase [Vampirovibrionales bacterium]|nr:uroporphyrinogen decarboxylase [Vampirovibrionales bacterium]